MLFNKEKRLKYVGFNDLWFSAIGILTLTVVTTYLFNNEIWSLSTLEITISLFVTLLFTIIDWSINRSIMIYLRKKFPDFRSDAKRITLFFFGIVCTVLLVDFIGISLLTLIPGISAGDFASRIRILVFVIILTIMIMALYEAIYYNIRLKASVREEEQSKQILIQAQLDALMNQAQPHFFFNTLNTLRDIIDQNSKEEAKEFVDKLSDMYRFLLEVGNDNLIVLTNELRFAKAYIHIQSERFGDNLKMNWDIPESASHKFIVPMSLQLLLENAIKHNVISKSKPLEIKVTVRDNSLVVSNKIAAKSTQLPSTKVGLANIKKRYALVSHETVAIENDEDHFTVSLPLLTSSDKTS